MSRTKIIGLFRLFRFELPFTAGICVILGQILALGAVPRFSQLVLGFSSIFFISATALILNDYFDFETDTINAPDRPLPAGLVSKQEVVLLSIIVALAGLITSALVGLVAFLVAAAVWLVGLAYNWRFKRTGLFGNLMVAFSVGMTFVYGGIVVGHPTDGIVWWFGLLAMLFDLGEEIASDAMDVEGDKLIGSRSLAIIIGAQNALKVSAVVFAGVIIVSVLPFLFRWLELIYLIPLALMDSIIVYSLYRLLAPGVDRPRRFIKWIYLGGSLSIFLFILMRFVLS